MSNYAIFVNQVWSYATFVFCFTSDIEEATPKPPDSSNTTIHIRSTLSRTTPCHPLLDFYMQCVLPVVVFCCPRVSTRVQGGVSVILGTSDMSEKKLCKCVFSCEKFNFSFFLRIKSIFRGIFDKNNYAITMTSLFQLIRSESFFL